MPPAAFCRMLNGAQRVFRDLLGVLTGAQAASAQPGLPASAEYRH